MFLSRISELFQTANQIFNKISLDTSPEQKIILLQQSCDKFQEIIAINGRHADSHFYLGIIYASLAKNEAQASTKYSEYFQLSFQHFDKAAEYNPTKREDYLRIKNSYKISTRKPANWFQPYPAPPPTQAKEIVADEEIITEDILEEIVIIRDGLQSPNMYDVNVKEVEPPAPTTENVVANIDNIIPPLGMKKRKIKK